VVRGKVGYELKEITKKVTRGKREENRLGGVGFEEGGSWHDAWKKKKRTPGRGKRWGEKKFKKTVVGGKGSNKQDRNSNKWKGMEGRQTTGVGQGSTKTKPKQKDNKNRYVK